MQFGPGFVATFLYYFASTAIVFTLVTALSLDAELTGIPRQVGLLGGIVGGITGAYFNRTVSIVLPIKGKKLFWNSLNPALTDLGYTLCQNAEGEDADGVRVYERTGLRKALSGKIYVQLEKDKATLSGRSAQIKAIQKRLA
ncbi:MAG: hypothetical protein Fur0046_24100 [Cyanobacteria bacterium J069]|nr:MAG: hypothetical protein D6742_12840 [Cyanobacteria bacterium J069]